LSKPAGNQIATEKRTLPLLERLGTDVSSMFGRIGTMEGCNWPFFHGNSLASSLV